MSNTYMDDREEESTTHVARMVTHGYMKLIPHGTSRERMNVLINNLMV